MKQIITLFFTCFYPGINMFSQNVGINTTSPDRPLTIQASGANNSLISLRNTSNTFQWYIDMLNDGLNFGQTGIADNRLFLSNGGNIGIGTNSPQYILDVRSNLTTSIARFTSISQVAQIQINNGNGTIIELGANDDGMYLGTNVISTGKDLHFRTASVNRIVIQDLTGNVGIGINNPAARLHVNGSAVFESDAVFNNTTDMVFLRVNGAIATRSAGINISGGPQTVDPGNKSYIRINNTSAVNALITLANGVTDGQILYILAGSGGGGSVQFFDNAVNNTQLNSDYQMGIDDTLTLIWNEALDKWIELHRSVN